MTPSWSRKAIPKMFSNNVALILFLIYTNSLNIWGKWYIIFKKITRTCFCLCHLVINCTCFSPDMCISAPWVYWKACSLYKKAVPFFKLRLATEELKGGDVKNHASLGRLCAANKKCVSACQSVTASGPSVQLSLRTKNTRRSSALSLSTDKEMHWLNRRQGKARESPFVQASRKRPSTLLQLWIILVSIQR